MTWLVFGVSCLLVLAGAASIISGAPIIQIERGWAEVIAGTVALSGGCIVFALAAILTRLNAMRDAIKAARSAAWQPLPVPVDDERMEEAAMPAAPDQNPPVSAAAEKVAELVASDASFPPVDEDMNERHGLWKRVRRPGAPAQPRLAAGETGQPDSLSAQPVEDRESPALIDPPTPVAAPVEPLPASTAAFSSHAEAPPVTPEEPGDEQALSWLDRSLFRARSKPIATRDIAPLPEVVAAHLAETPPSSGLEPGSAIDEPVAFSETDAAPTQSDTPAESHDAGAPADDVTVIGRYQAGVASYIMYSDGTIQVETEGGETHRFASMEQLKAYIASQDNPVS